MLFYLYWDESDENDPSYEKIRRAAYATLDEAIAQGTHDLLCQRCRVRVDGKTVNEATGIEPLDSKGKERCRDCGGTKLCPSRRILHIEKISEASARTFHAESKGVESPTLNRGDVVWTTADLKV
jgi:hypothetical protein